MARRIGPPGRRTAAATALGKHVGRLGAADRRRMSLPDHSQTLPAQRHAVKVFIPIMLGMGMPFAARCTLAKAKTAPTRRQMGAALVGGRSSGERRASTVRALPWEARVRRLPCVQGIRSSQIPPNGGVPGANPPLPAGYRYAARRVCAASARRPGTGKTTS